MNQEDAALVKWLYEKNNYNTKLMLAVIEQYKLNLPQEPPKAVTTDCLPWCIMILILVALLLIVNVAVLVR